MGDLVDTNSNSKTEEYNIRIFMIFNALALVALVLNMIKLKRKQQFKLRLLQI